MTTIAVRVAQASLRLASVRYRGLLPALALEELGCNVSVSSGRKALDGGHSLLYAVKPLTAGDELCIDEWQRLGRPFVVDLCDNVFIQGYGNQGREIGNRFRRMALRASAIAVPTRSMAKVVCSECDLDDSRVVVVPDIVEDRDMLRRQQELLNRSGVALRAADRPWRDALAEHIRDAIERRPILRPKRLLWFGNKGAPYASFGIGDLRVFSEAMRRLSRECEIELWVVSNSREVFDEVTIPMGVRARYFEWDEWQVDRRLCQVDVCLVPNSGDQFSVTKSANRALKALAANVPVVATMTEAYEELSGAVWLGDPLEGLRAMLFDVGARNRMLENARAVIDERYSLKALKGAMVQVMERARP